ncbi:MAG: VanZ family protein [Deltaproteobacteria bacterium]|nr:VanZ family protein [Deltaproteobacteria bacterium]
MSPRPLAVVAPSRWWAGFAVIVAIAGLGSGIAYGPGLPDAFGRHQIDKLLHFLLAGLLAFFLDGALGRRALRIGAWGVPLAALLVVVPTGIEEYLQRFSTERTSSVWDFAADVAGVALFVPLSRRAAK